MMVPVPQRDELLVPQKDEPRQQGGRKMLPGRTPQCVGEGGNGDTAANNKLTDSVARITRA